MRVLIDACVLYPTVLREIVTGVIAATGATPLWSGRILEEWARAAARLGAGQEALARGEIALLRAAWPEAEVTVDPATEARLWLPDASDVHVLAAAIDGRADILLTLNLRDFPKRTLDADAILLRDPDVFLLDRMETAPHAVRGTIARVHAEAERLSGETMPVRALLKRARLPRVAKALAA
jgi:predicted nucleic acid-binding protein